MDVCLYYKCYACLIVVCNDVVVSIFGIFMIMIMNLGDIDIGLTSHLTHVMMMIIYWIKLTLPMRPC